MVVLHDKPAQCLLCCHVLRSSQIAKRFQGSNSKRFLCTRNCSFFEQMHSFGGPILCQSLYSLRLQPAANQRRMTGKLMPIFLQLSAVHSLSDGVVFWPRASGVTFLC